MPSPFSRTTRSLAGDDGKCSLVAWALGAFLFSAWFAWFGWSEVAVYELSRQARLEVQQAPHPAATPIAGRIASVGLAIGQAVKAGDVLVELDASSEQLRLQEEESRLAAIAPKLRSIKSEIALLENAGQEDDRAAKAAIDSARHRAAEAAAGVAFARDNEKRLKDESAVGGVARVEALRAISETQKLSAVRDSLTAELRKVEAEALNRRKQHQAQIENLNRSLISLDGEARTLRATISRLQSEIARHTIRAPVDGRIGEVNPLRPGSYVAEGQRLATVVPSGELLILADFVPGSAAGRLVPGQRAEMRLDAFPWAQYGTLHARVSRVSSELRDGLIRAELQVDANGAPPLLLQHGLQGSVEVAIEKSAPALLVLRAAGQVLSRSAAPPSPVPAVERKS